MDKNQLRQAITEVLKWFTCIPFSEDAVELLMLTAAQESRLGHYIEQVNGPALGIFQMEPSTEKDLWKNYLLYQTDIREEIYKIITPLSPFPQLKYDLIFQIVMARLHYYRRPEPLPKKEDIEGMAAYYKKHYNTPKGKATAAEAAANYRRLCL